MERGRFGVPEQVRDLADGELRLVEIAAGRRLPHFVQQLLIRHAGVGQPRCSVRSDIPSTRAIHAFRAIETGIPIVRAAASGISGAFDPWGRVIGLTDYFAPGDRSLTVQLPVGSVRTMYTRIGDALGWLCVAVLAIALATTLIGRRTNLGFVHGISESTHESTAVIVDSVRRPTA